MNFILSLMCAIAVTCVASSAIDPNMKLDQDSKAAVAEAIENFVENYFAEVPLGQNFHLVEYPAVPKWFEDQIKAHLMSKDPAFVTDPVLQNLLLDEIENYLDDKMAAAASVAEASKEIAREDMKNCKPKGARCESVDQCCNKENRKCAWTWWGLGKDRLCERIGW